MCDKCNDALNINESSRALKHYCISEDDIARNVYTVTCAQFMPRYYKLEFYICDIGAHQNTLVLMKNISSINCMD